MNKTVRLFLPILILSFAAAGQTSWKGTTSTSWGTAANWTAGVPGSTVDAIVGDANFTGPNQPTISATAACKSLTLGGAVAATLTVNKTTTVSGNILINANATISHGAVSLTLTGNWIKHGTYNATTTTSAVIFAGTTEAIQGSSATTFRKLTINAGSITTMAADVTVSGASSLCTVKGTLNPGESPSYKLTVTDITVASNGNIKVTGAQFTDNYAISGITTLSAGSIVEYSATVANQVISAALTYSTLTISGAGIKSLITSLPALNASSSSAGKILVTAATLDLGAYTANRGTTVTGGTISVSNGATLKIGSTGTFPTGFNTTTLSLASTVEYNGTDQVIAAKTYGNLKLNAASGAVMKNFAAAAFTVSGNFTSAVGAGSSVSCILGANLTVTGTLNIGTATTLNASLYNIALASSWVNDGIFMGGSGTLTMSGAGTTISGSGTQGFNNLTLSGSGITAPATTLSLTGNLVTSGSGTFTHNAGGTITMTGTSKTITGTGMILTNLAVTGTVTTTSTFTLTGNLDVSGSLTQTSGTVTMNGTAKTITGGGTIVFKTLQVTGTVIASTSFSIGTSLVISGTFSASAGTATFTGTSTFNGTANLNNVTINGSSLILAASSVMGIAGSFTITAGSLNTTTNIPNTVNFNGSGAQTVNAATYYHLWLSNGNTKTAAGNTTVNGNLNIGASTTFSAGSYTHTLSGNWINNGSFTPGTSTVKFSGAANSSASGATTFNILTIAKSTSSLVTTLQSNMTAATVNMTTGSINTSTSSLTITTTRTGTGIILGTITRTHSFTTGTAYAFEGADNYINFSAVSGVTSVTVNVTMGAIGDYPSGASINRVYTTTIPSGTYTATFRLHYEDADLNGNSESAMQLWKYNGVAWVLSGKTANSITSNYVEQTLLADITNRWTCSDNASVIKWNGSTSGSWATAANWTPAVVPGSLDIAQVGTIAFINQPSITSSVTVKSLAFGSAQAATLTIGSGGSLITNGNINGTWSANATHTINTGAQNLTVNGDMTLSDGTAGHAINLSAGAGVVTINGSLTESGGAAVSFTGAGTLSIKNDFTYSSGAFTAGSSTVIYNGTGVQAVAPVSYNNITVTKTAGIANLNGAATIAGNLSVTAGELDINAGTTVTGNVSISSGATLYGGGITLNVAGNWTNSGTFNAGTGLVNLNGTGAQVISASAFNDLTVNKSAGTASLAGNITLGGSLSLQGGNFDLGTYTANRNADGGQLTVADGVTLFAGAANNFPLNYATVSLGAASTVHYNGTVAQSVAGVNYGNLVFSNGGSNAKTLTGSLDVAGDITLNSSTTVDASTYTINLSGNWNNSGTFTASSGTLVLNGTGKTITGTTVFNKVTVNGSYTVAGSDITYNGLLYVTATGSFAAGAGTATVNGDLTNSGILTSSGTTTFSGTTLQTIHLNNAINSTSTGIVNFNGNVSPVLNSTSTPTFANLNINNTAGINPSVNWLILVSMNVGSGGVFNGGTSAHSIIGSFTNNGTVTSSGTMNFSPPAATTISLGSSSFTSTGTVIFGGAGALTVTGTPAAFNDVRVTSTNAAGITPSSAWTVNGDLVIASNSIFNAGTWTHTIAGDIESNGTLNGGNSTVVMSSPTGLLTGSPNTTFNHLTITGSVAANSDFNVAGNFTNNGSYDGSVGTLIMTGSSNAVIGGTASPSSIAQLTIAKSGAPTLVTLAGNVSDIFTLYINSGTLFTSTYGLTQDAGGGLLMISNGATLRLGGTNSMPGFSAFGLEVYSTVDYAGTSQLVGNAAAYGNLVVSAAGNKLATAPLIIQNDFTLSAGTFISNVSVTHSVAGNWTMTGGTFSNASSTILFNGSGDQYIASTGAFNNVSVNKVGGLVYLSGNVATNSVLSLAAGKISLGNYDLIIGNTGSITGAGTANYIVAAGAGSLVQQVLAGGSKLFPVGLTNAYTPATINMTAGSVTDNFSLRMLAQAYAAGTSGTVITTNSVRATWMIAEAVTGGSNASVTLQWPSSLEQSGFNRTFGRLAHYSSGVWDYGVTDIPAGGSNPYYITRAGFTGFSPFIVTKFDPLPVTWLTVTGTRKPDGNHINWSTAAEMNNNYFVVEVSADGSRFSEAGRVDGSINSTTTQQYSFVDGAAGNGTYYYRVKQVDLDGKYSYSAVVKIATTGQLVNPISISPNPVGDQATLSVSSDKNVLMSVLVTNMSGQVIYKTKQKVGIGTSQLSLNLGGQASGMYLLNISDDAGNSQVLRFVKK